MQVSQKKKRKSSMNRFQKMQPARSRIRSLCMLGLIVFSTAVWAGAIKVKWNANSEPDLAGYRVHVGEAKGIYTNIIDVGDTTEHVITDAAYGKPYYVSVSAYDDSDNESELSAEVSITLKAPDIRAVRSAHGLRLSWQPVAGADSYEIFRDADPYFIADQPFILTPDTTFLDDAFVPVRGAGVYYQVVALRNGATVFTFSRIGGYTVCLNKGINLLSLPLIPDSAGVNSVLGDQLTGGSNKSSSDYVMTFKEQNQTETAWKVAGTGSPLDGKWVTEDGSTLSTLSLLPDQAFWLYRRAGHTDSLLTLTGLVSSDSNRVLTLNPGINYIGTCYPETVALPNSALSREGVLHGGSSSGQSDKVLVYHPTGYKFAWLVAGTHTLWDGKFMNESGTQVSPISLNPGQGYIIWLKNSATPIEWNYPNPIYNN